MKKEYHIILIFALFSIVKLHAQGIVAAQLEKETGATQVSIRAEILRKGSSDVSDSILFKWGDGVEEELPVLSYGYLPSVNLTLAVYHGFHAYEEPGLYELSFADGFLIDGIKNIESSGQKMLNFKDTISLLPQENPDSNNEAPFFLGDPTIDDLIVDENGVIKYIAVFDQEFYTPIEDFRTSIAPFPASGYSPPPGNLYMDGNILVWDKPIEPGLFGVCIKVREFRQPREEGQDSLFMSTAHRAIVLEIDSNFIVSNLSFDSIEGLVSIFPNPANSTLNIQLQHNQSTQGKLQIENLSGQTLHTETLNLSPNLQSWQVDVADWPSGVYVVRLQAGADQVVRKFVKE